MGQQSSYYDSRLGGIYSCHLQDHLVFQGCGFEGALLSEVGTLPIGG